MIIVVIDSNQLYDDYDVILKSNYTTNNDTAIRLEALFENDLETQLIGTIYIAKYIFLYFV